MASVNNTKNQHFLSQIEQRLNAINPEALPSNQKIYSFTLRDRENYVVDLDDKQGKSIASNLLLYDLFSFDVINKKTRMNFETLFQQYEADIKENTESLLKKLAAGDANIKAEVLNIFAAKFLNFIRNPYSVIKMLNNVSVIGNFKPTQPDMLQMFNAIISGKKPQQKYLCLRLGISDSEYEDWLLALFMLLTRFEDGQMNILEHAVKNLFEDPSCYIMVNVYRYIDEHSDKRCLLSDRGYSTPLSHCSHLALDFNLHESAFIQYIFYRLDEIAPMAIAPSILEIYKKQPKTVELKLLNNDLEALSRYNRHVLYQCHNNVYSSSRAIFGLTCYHCE